MDGEHVESYLVESPEELAAVALASPLARMHHKHAGEHDAFGDEDEPLPLDAFGAGPSASSDPLPHWGGTNTLVTKPAEKKHPSKGSIGLLQRLSVLDEDRAGRRTREQYSASRKAASALRRVRPFEFRADEPIRVRVLDVDAIPIGELHRAFAFTLVRRLPAELCIRVAARIATFRDTFSHKKYESLINDSAKLFGPTHGPELLALFARCHATISVQYLVDYTRRYGTFSRKFIAANVNQALEPNLFDFMRYQKTGGVKALPPIVARPWALSSYTRLMTKSHIKSKMYEQLQIHGAIPKHELNPDVMPEDLPVEARAAERLSHAAALKVEAPVAASEYKKAQQRPWRPGEGDGRRPPLLDAIMEAEYSGRGWNPTDDKAVRAAAKTAQVRSERRASGGGRPVPAPAENALSDGEGSSDDEGDDGPRSRWAGIELDDDDDGHLNASRGGDPSRPRRSGLGLQFEHVVPDSELGLGSGSDLVPAGFRGAAGGQAELRGDEMDLTDLPERFWNRLRRPFFRHNYRAYRLIDGQWKHVNDPRGPRHQPRRRHKPRSETREKTMMARGSSD